jgi:glycosyltransferase involved in cell wall biosynthesis
MLGMVRGLAEVVDPGTRVTLLVNTADADALPGLPPQLRVRRASFRPRVARLAFQQLLLPAFAALRGIDVVHSPAFITPQLRGGARHLLTVHDLTSFSLPDSHTRLRRSAAYRALVARSIRRADGITVPSRWVADDLLARFPEVEPERVSVDMPGIGARFRPLDADERAPALRRLGVTEPYLLFVGTLQPRKNLRVLLDAYARLAAEGRDLPQLVLAGGLGWGDPGVEDALARPGLRERIVLPGYVSEDDLPALYAGAALFVFPSLAEGFGFPPLEAMACGTPVVAADGSSRREQLAGAAALVPAEDAEALAATIARLLDDGGERARLLAAGLDRARSYTWAAMGRRIADRYFSLARA